ncbi:MAG: hypothetical protein WD766_08765 [Gemmatimonadota bacterium]
MTYDATCRLSFLLLLAGATSCSGAEPEVESIALDSPVVAGGSGAVAGSVATGSPARDTLPTADEGAASAAEWTAGIVERDNEVTGAPILADARIARNQGFDRMVVEFEGDEIPSYHIEYVDSPIRQCGSGNAIVLRGDGWLLIRMEPAQAHDEEGRATIEERAGEPGLPIILEHRLICDFEGVVEWALGVSSPNRYRVMELQEPARLVVDVRH